MSKFDPTNTTHLIVAASLGGRNGGLGSLNHEDALHVHEKALNVKVEYKGLNGFQEADGRAYTELSNLQASNEGQRSTSSLFPGRFTRSTP